MQQASTEQRKRKRKERDWGTKNEDGRKKKSAPSVSSVVVHFVIFFLCIIKCCRNGLFKQVITHQADKGKARRESKRGTSQQTQKDCRINQ